MAPNLFSKSNKIITITKLEKKNKKRTTKFQTIYRKKIVRMLAITFLKKQEKFIMIKKRRKVFMEKPQ